ncbi:MAG TPA: ATP-dependent DNA ligase [Candidatus Avipropionibacterium avicola]|uniref:ATP-dependent DNA ligase n=1 Tax=Candidatus Avipropionibacterium avicola TaxID=2840701 RepID=A0A9D1H020_9ACTN|nr:ATP-dependent DNA ligase [Candidatus Avipropionibacterium avicola]
MSVDIWTEAVKPMLAKAVPDIPEGLAYEPKWDGFRCIVQRDGDRITLWSRGSKDLTVYFPELVDSLARALPPRCVVDGEIVVIRDGRLEFERLQERIHPAESRIRKLSAEIPADFIAFDLIGLGEESLLDEPATRRRERLVESVDTTVERVHLTPQTLDLDTARRWFTEFEGAGLDGVIGKALDLTYQPDKRAMVKIKHKRTADVVVVGYRLHKNSTASEPLLGSLQLGLFNDEGVLQFVGVASSFPTKRRGELVAELAKLEVTPDHDDWDEHPWSAAAQEWDRRPGAISRWSASQGRSEQAGHLIWPMPVIEISYDYFEGTRLRHNGQFVRWRPDRDPQSCTYDQIEVPQEIPVTDVLTL